MATSRDDSIAYLKRLYGKDAETQFTARMERLDAVIEALRANGMAPWIKVFGSAVAKADQVPGDIDVFVDLADVQIDPAARKEAIWNLLQLSVAGGYHGNYGLFDPFVLNRKGVLSTRNEADSRLNVAWQRAQEADAIIAAGRAGMPLATFARRFHEQFGKPAETREVPTMRETIQAVSGGR
jgi:predicted nucleotidyltransferase